jgi:hypothetical protein
MNKIINRMYISLVLVLDTCKLCKVSKSIVGKRGCYETE